jgi:hypothetical protein
MPSLPTSITGFLRAFAVVIAACAALSGIALGGLTYTEAGHAFLARQIAHGVNRSICGRLVVDRVTRVDWPALSAEGVRILDPEGRPAIAVERATVHLSLRDMLAGRAGWARAEVSDGTVYVTQDARGRLNMSETFKHCGPSHPASAGSGEIDLRKMATSKMALVIGGGSLPALRMTGLRGVMRVHVLASGDTELLFDGYRGRFEKGLPTGLLVFADVQGSVHSAGTRLLRFDGRGESEGEHVDFTLDIVTAPRTRARIDATFARVTAESVATRALALWTAFSPGLQLVLHRPGGDGERGAAERGIREPQATRGLAHAPP